MSSECGLVGPGVLPHSALMRTVQRGQSAVSDLACLWSYPALAKTLRRKEK